ncbi:MAG TPA: VWA domain-containing protein [Pyrinomonadaceae bacterium]
MTQFSKRHYLPVFFLLFAFFNTALPQQKPPSKPTQDDDIIRTNTNVVQIDAVVTDKDGKVVTDLGIDDFEILEEGKPVKAQYFSFVPLTENTTTSARTQISPDSQPTAQQLKRTFVFLVDNPVINYGIVDSRGLSLVTIDINLLPRAVRASLEAEKVLRWFVDGEMTASDLVAISDTEVNIGVLASFTNDRDLLHAAMDRIRQGVAQGEHKVIRLMNINGEASLQDLIHQNLQIIDTVDRTIDQLANLPGRKIVTLISRGMIYDPRLPGSDKIRERLAKLTEKANQNHVTFYTLSPSGIGNLGGMSPMANRGEGPGSVNAFAALQGTQDIGSLIYMAKETGGRAIYGTNDTSIGLAKILEENSGYYMLGYDPGPEAVARPHKVKVVMKRPGLNVQARTTAFATNRPIVATSPAAALNLPVARTDIPLELTPLFISPDGKRSRLLSILHVDLHGLSLTPETDHLDVLVRITGPDGTTVKEEASRMVLRKGVSQREVDEGIFSVSAIEDAVPGYYRVSAAVTDPKTGFTGAVNKFIEVANPASKDLTASSLIISNPRPAGTDSESEIPSLAQRRFASNGPLNYDCMVYNLRAQGNQPTQMQVDLVIKNGNATVVSAPSRTITGDASTSLSVGGTLTLPDLPLGTYSLEISLSDLRHKDRRVVRSASFRVVNR